MGQFRDLILHLAEVTVKGLFQPLHGNPWRKAVVKVFEGQAKLGAEFIKGHLFDPALRKDEIGCRQNGRQIIHQCSRPIEDDVLNHARNHNAESSNLKLKTHAQILSGGRSSAKLQPRIGL